MTEREEKSIMEVMNCIGNFFTSTGLTEDYDSYYGHDVDVTGTTANGKVYYSSIEVKERNLNGSDLIKYIVNDEGLMIEKVKYKHLINQPNPIYVNYIYYVRFELILVWKISNINVKEEKDIIASKTTEFGNNQKVNKPSYLLSGNDCSLVFIRHKDIITEFPWHKTNINNVKKILKRV